MPDHGNLPLQCLKCCSEERNAVYEVALASNNAAGNWGTGVSVAECDCCDDYYV